ncbi:MAG: polysaccharide biosynthesis C-terminal domain-containing protein [Bacteroidetes bacterium]|nr:polysaccharide biosynthesis C-terminal domain-containing protein [Bacteroidota bacterium]
MLNSIFEEASPAMQITRLIYKNFTWRIFFYATLLLLNIGIARSLGAAVSGNFNFFLNDLNFFLLIGSLSLDSGIIYYVSKKKTPENILTSFAITWSVIASVFISGLFLFFFKDHTGTFSGYFLFFACFTYITGTFLITYFTALFYSRDDYKTSNLVAGIANLVLLLFIPWDNSWSGLVNVKTFFYIFFIVNFLMGAVLALVWLKREKTLIQLFRVKVNELSPVFRYSLTALIGNVSYFLLYRIDYWFVEYYCSAKSLGNYIQVSKLGQMLVLPAMIVAGILFPQSSKDNISFQTPFFKKMMLVVTACYILGAVLVLLAGQPLILFLWGNEYDEMYWPLVILMPGIIFLSVSYLFSPIFSGLGKVKYNVYIALCTLLAVIIANFLLIPRWGIRGAALATSIGFLLMMILYIIIANKKSGLSLKKG